VTLSSILVRLGNALIVTALVALLTFLLIDLAPGRYLGDLATNRQISAEAVERMRVQFGLDQPFYRKFLRWGRSVGAATLNSRRAGDRASVTTSGRIARARPGVPARQRRVRARLVLASLS
jgi:ABC-type dipeptide/oligopeptide/nickel transport system permease component